MAREPPSGPSGETRGPTDGHGRGRSRSRRTVLAGLVGVGAALGGCLGDGPPPGLHAVSATVLYRPGFGETDYPGDVAVRVTVENTSSQRRRGRLEVTLERTDGAESDASQRWQQTRGIELQSGTARSYIVVFEGLFETEVASERLSASARSDRGTPTTGG